MKAEAIVRKALKVTNSIENYIVLMVIVLLIAFAGYALWDSSQIHQTADKSHYMAYKPTAANQGKSFKELQALNADIIAWLSVLGTNIDYPVAQAKDNMKYVNTDAEGLYSLSGSIFLDCNNSNDFSDFNSILYGHHMAYHVMFGEIDSFSDKNVFDSHKYGNLYFDGKEHGIEFFAFIRTDAYDRTVYTPDVQGQQRQTYLDGLLAKAIYIRDVGVTTEDHIILLSTCSSSSTNGRDILVGRITDEVYDDPAIDTTTSDGIWQTGLDDTYSFVKKFPILILLFVLLLLLLLIGCILVIKHRRNKNKTGQNREGGDIHVLDTQNESEKSAERNGCDPNDTDCFNASNHQRRK
jgi:sortase B